MVLALLNPGKAFAEIGSRPPGFASVFFGKAIWLGLVPPVCAYIGTSTMGWHLGIGEPLEISTGLALIIAAAYYLLLLGGFAAAVLLMRWMAPTYGATVEAGAHAALLVIAAAPLMLGSLLHLYPQIGVNLMALVPAMMWSAYLLYTGLHKALKTDPDRGMLMATSLLGVFFVAANALMILTMILWTLGIGPDIGFNWRFSVG